MSKKEIVESYEKVFMTFREPIRETRTSARARLVWFVGIAGLRTSKCQSVLGGFRRPPVFWN